MTAHALLPGCETPWQHSCPGRIPGRVCHCPCHRLEARVDELKQMVRELGGETEDLTWGAEPPSF